MRTSTKLVIWVGMVLAMTAFMVWLFWPLFQDQSQSGTEIVIGGFPGGHITINANSPVCVIAMSESSFEVTTPSGKLVPSVQVGQYSYGEGCFSPGVWKFTGDAPAMRLTNPVGMTAVSFTPNRVKYGIPGMFLVIAAVYGLVTFFVMFRRKS